MRSPTSAEELLTGLARRELVLDYQATFDLETMQPRGAEALLRWDHPERGVLRPGEFLSVMASGLGSALVRDGITRFVLDRAITQCAEWRRAGLDIPVSVNVAPCSLNDDSVPRAIEQLLQREQVPAHRLTIEVTEQVGKLDGRPAREALDGIAGLDVRLSLDDFGTGDASLQRLQTLLFDEIKIDQSFVAGVCRRPVDRHIVEFTVGLATELGMSGVAEGVERSPLLSVLREIGPVLAQGYYLHRPSTPDEVAAQFRPTLSIVLRPPVHDGVEVLQ
jgi:EAL domain-containing protein (putative c-di-GMP-specific phosphodiesterase class I)